MEAPRTQHSLQRPHVIANACEGRSRSCCALVKHDVSGLRVTDTLRVTEDAVEKPLAKVGLIETVTRAWASSCCAWRGACASVAAIS